MPAAADPPRWFAMLNTGDPPEEWQRLARDLEALTGADVDVLPHLTIGSAIGDAEMDAVAAAFERVRGPRCQMRLRPPIDFHQSERLHFRWTIAIAVQNDAAFHAWHERTQTAFRTAGLESARAPADWVPHVTILRGSDRRPSLDEATRQQAISLLESRASAMDLSAVRLHVSRLAEGRFKRVLDRPLS